MASTIHQYRVSEATPVRLVDRPTRADVAPSGGDEYRSALRQRTEALHALQEVLYADNRRSLLIIFQAMDAAGKDGVIEHVMSGVNPQGCQVFSFKQPSDEELDHDFLWRTTRALPERGRIGIFNRSYYEEVLIVRVHPGILQAQRLPTALLDDPAIWEGRYQSIRDLEAHLSRNGTTVLKFFLHISKEEQRHRFLARIDEPEKNWKFALADVEERAHWEAYMAAYEACISATSTAASPWYIVPADHKKSARLIVSDVMAETLRGMNLAFPDVSDDRRRELQAIRAVLAAEAPSADR
jgi:PPK2 family polyphosphate:nucleotide phosphotransferase